MLEQLGALLPRIRTADREALNAFVTRYIPLLRARARRWIRRLRIEHEIEPDELLDATILEICRNARQIQAVEPGEFLNYVERIVHSQACLIWRQSRARKRGGGRRVTQEPVTFDTIDRRAAPICDLELSETLTESYEQLSGAERTLALLRRSGWSWHEIAGSLATTAEAARKRWLRAVARVQQQL
jgi:RNA polymerase sigma factor (sigma-70 family)